MEDTNNLFRDLFVSEVSDVVLEDAEGGGKRLKARVATLDVINRNGRMLNRGVLGENKVSVMVSEWGHNSTPGFFESSVTPMTYGDLTESNGAIHLDAVYPNLQRTLDAFAHLKHMRDMLGFSLTYRPTEYTWAKSEDEEDMYLSIDKADFYEVTPDSKYFVASPGTKVEHMDITQPTTPIPEKTLKDYSIEELIRELNSRSDKRYGDITEVIKFFQHKHPERS